MADKTINTRQKQKYDTSTNWINNNPVLLAGEIGIESDTNKMKVGNGTSTWNNLEYAGSPDIKLYTTTGQNTDGAMTQKAVSDALSQAVTVTLTESQNFNDIVISNEQFELLLSNPENYLIIETSNGSLTISLKYRRSQYVSVSVEGASQEMLIFNCVNSTSLSFAPYAQRIDSLTVIKQTQNGESVIVVTDDTLDFTTFVPKTRTINGKSLSNDITLTATDVNALPDTTEIPSTLADLTDDSTHRTVTDTEKSTWNAKSDFSGSYNDLTDKPTIPSDNTQLTNGAGYVTQTEVNTSVVTKTAVNVNGALQQTLNFDSDPQTQLDNKVNKEGAEFVDDVLFTSSSNNNKIRLQLNSASPIGIPRISFSKDNHSYFLGIRQNDQNINCLYVNTVFWADFIYTQSLKNAVDGRDLTKLHADYDSGWFDFSAATTYTFTHNLGTTEFYTLIDMRYNGSGPLYTQNTMINSDGQSNSYAGGINETYRTTTQIWLRGAKNYAMQFSSAANTKGYYTDRSLNDNCQARVRLFKIV